MVCAELLSESLRDSPKFRSLLADNESQIELLELKLDKVLKMCGIMVDSGKTYVSQQSLFANSVWELSTCFRGDSNATASLNKLIHGLQEMNKYHTILLDQASRTILKNLTSFLKEDIQGVWESRHHFNKISGDLDIAINRHAQASKSKPLEIEQSQNILQASSDCFRYNVLDHVHCISMLQARKKHEIFGTFVSYLHACSTYFHQGSDLCEGISPFLKDLSQEVNRLREETVKLEKSLGNRHNLVAKSNEHNAGNPMEGYLFKRTSNAFKTWHRRWFCLKDHQLIYRKRTGEEEYTVMEEDLKLCSVKPVDCDRRFCFEVMSPTRSHILQADSEELYNRWVRALQEGIGAALQQGMSEVNHNRCEIKDFNGDTPNIQRARICEQIQSVPGNDECCDCRAPKPSWASINLGIVMCIECSGIHRSLGVHHSKVRSLTLDSWEPEVLKVMIELGNSVVNRVYEATLPSDFPRISPSSTRSEKEEFIKLKWLKKQFVSGLVVRGGSPGREGRKWSVRRLRRRGRSREGAMGPVGVSAGATVVLGDDEPALPASSVDIDSDDDSTSGEDNTSTVGEEEMCRLNPTMLLFTASAAHNLPVMCRALALSADKMWTNSEQQGLGHLHQAVSSGSVMACEYLVLNSVPVDSQDEEGMTPLHLAVKLGHTGQVCLLLKHKADQHIKDRNGKDPLDTAVDMANADIVTLLRLGRLNEEIRESEPGGGDETFNDVVRDFSHLGSDASKSSVRKGTPSNSSPTSSSPLLGEHS